MVIFMGYVSFREGNTQQHNNNDQVRIPLHNSDRPIDAFTSGYISGQSSTSLSSAFSMIKAPSQKYAE